jgi:hypothetical protein
MTKLRFCLRFYGHFAAAYGTLWFLLMTAAVCMGAHIETGMIGLIGFPVISLIYSIVRLVIEIVRSKSKIVLDSQDEVDEPDFED